MSQAATVASPSRPLRYVARSLARRCQGRTLMLGRGWPEVEAELRSQGVDIAVQRVEDLEAGSATATPTIGTSGADGGAERFDTVLLAKALELETGQERLSNLIQHAWNLVSDDGRLIVCVPNREAVADSDDNPPGFDRRRLKRLLQQIDRPRVVTDQPYAWLVMSIDARPGLDRTSQQRHQTIARLCREPVIELGCAQGHLARAIADRGLSVTGVDKSALKITRARAMFPEIQFVEADILELPATSQYATVVLAEVLEHVLEDVGDWILAKAWELVAPGGRLIVSVPNEDCVPHPNHVRQFDRLDLSRTLRRFGRPRLVTEQPFKWLLMYVDRTA